MAPADSLALAEAIIPHEDAEITEDWQNEEADHYSKLVESFNTDESLASPFADHVHPDWNPKD